MELEPIKGFLNGLKGTKQYDGTCEKHGDSTITVLPSYQCEGWYCSDCRHEQWRADDHARHMAERLETLHRAAELPARFRGQKFHGSTPDQRLVRTTVKAFKDAITSERKWATLILTGTTGTGKTLLATELAESLINGLHMKVRYCTAKQLVSEIQAAYSTEGKTEEGEILRFSLYDVLVIDEIDAKPDRENANLLLNDVINRRYNANRPVVAITNQPFDSLARFVGERIDSRLHENSFICHHNWADARRDGGGFGGPERRSQL